MSLITRLVLSNICVDATWIKQDICGYPGAKDRRLSIIDESPSEIFCEKNMLTACMVERQNSKFLVWPQVSGYPQIGDTICKARCDVAE